jgi:hypothetical protein
MTFRIRVSLALFLAATAVIATVGLLAAAGATWWQDDGVEVCGAANSQEVPQLTTDGSGGAIVVWADKRDSSTTGNDIYAQRVDAYGNNLWTADGVSVCTAASGQIWPQIASDESGGAIVTWRDNRGSDEDIYVQRVDGDGNALWTADGVSLCTAASNQISPQIVPDGAGGAVVAWVDDRDSSVDIYAQRVDKDGNVLWHADGVSLCTAAEGQWSVQLAPDGTGGAIVTWDDWRSASESDIYARRVNASGNTLWHTDGVTICAAAGDQDAVQVLSDGSGGAMIVWVDWRPGGDSDIYAQRVNASGTTLWTADGVSLCTATGNGALPQMVADGSGGAIATWIDLRTGDFNVYAQRMDQSGNTLWQADGLTVCAAAQIQSRPQIASDGSGGAIVTWQDLRSGSYLDIFAQKMDGDGNMVWQVDGISVCVAAKEQNKPQIVSDGRGAAIVTWQDKRVDGSYPDIYAQRVGERNSVSLPLVTKNH